MVGIEDEADLRAGIGFSMVCATRSFGGVNRLQSESAGVGLAIAHTRLTGCDQTDPGHRLALRQVTVAHQVELRVPIANKP